MLASIIRHLRAAAGRILNRIRTAIREASRPLPMLGGYLADVMRSRRELLMERLKRPNSGFKAGLALTSMFADYESLSVRLGPPQLHAEVSRR